MFRFILSGLALIAAAALYLFHVRLSSADLPFYRKLVQESIDLHAHSALETSPVRQMRKGVRKDIWMVKEGIRTHGRIVCAHSDMTLTQKKEKMEAVEILREIEAWMDVEGEIRHITAESGVCYFPSCRMETRHLIADFADAKWLAKETHLTKDKVELLGSFQIEHPQGRLFGEKGTLIKGEMNQIQLEEGILFEAAEAPFSIASMRAAASLPKGAPLSELFAQEIRFQDGVEIQTVYGIHASGGSATFHQNSLRLFSEPAPQLESFLGLGSIKAPRIDDPKGELLGSPCSLFHESGRIDAKEICFDRAANELLFLSPFGRLEEKKTLFDAATGVVHFQKEGFHPHTLLLEGNVRIASRLQEKDSFAMADSATFHVNEKKIVLESAPLSRVLFRQECFEISAPTVHIQEAIQGFGDVRFFFYPEEKTSLDTIFLKYL